MWSPEDAAVFMYGLVVFGLLDGIDARQHEKLTCHDGRTS
jgi:hypothetical protein